jgi:hypothetical protein
MDAQLNRLLFSLKNWDSATLTRVVSECGGTLVRAMPEIKYAVVELPVANAADIARAYVEHPAVEDVEFDQKLRPAGAR